MWRYGAAIKLATDLGLDPEKLAKWLEYSGVSGELERLEAARKSSRERAKRHRAEEKISTKGPSPQTPLPLNLHSLEEGEDTNNTNTSLTRTRVIARLVPPDDTDAVVALFQAWNELGTRLRPIRDATKARCDKASAAIRKHGLDICIEAIRCINSDPFCGGENNRGWVATIDFFLRPHTISRVTEGEFGGKAKLNSASDRPKGAAYRPVRGPSLRAIAAEAEAAARGNSGGAELPAGALGDPSEAVGGPDEGDA